jgi:hypothetical protein
MKKLIVPIKEVTYSPFARVDFERISEDDATYLRGRKKSLSDKLEPIPSLIALGFLIAAFPFFWVLHKITGAWK